MLRWEHAHSSSVGYYEDVVAITITRKDQTSFTTLHSQQLCSTCEHKEMQLQHTMPTAAAVQHAEQAFAQFASKYRIDTKPAQNRAEKHSERRFTAPTFF